MPVPILDLFGHRCGLNQNFALGPHTGHGYGYVFMPLNSNPGPWACHDNRVKSGHLIHHRFGCNAANADQQQNHLDVNNFAAITTGCNGTMRWAENWARSHTGLGDAILGNAARCSAVNTVNLQFVPCVGNAEKLGGLTTEAVCAGGGGIGAQTPGCVAGVLLYGIGHVVLGAPMICVLDEVRPITMREEGSCSHPAVGVNVADTGDWPGVGPWMPHLVERTLNLTEETEELFDLLPSLDNTIESLHIDL